ncbi:hypothetical protein LDENG_00284650 [Lucifuga dentata]|nr:hypothetical protein LDENG_00284650 [Lucifuga dentata]
MKPMVLMKSGVLVQAMSDQQFSGRIKLLRYMFKLGIEIENLQKRDSGHFEIRDQDGNLGLVLQLKVEEEPPIFQYIAIPVGIIIGLIFCCCCVRKCCCTKSSSKSDEAVPQSEDAPALPVYHHNTPQPAETSYSASPQFLAHTHHPNSPINFSNPTSSSINPPDIQPAGTSYSGPSQLPPPYTYHPINSSEPTSSPLDPPVFSPAGVHMSSSQPQVTPQGTASSVPFGSDSLSLAPEHQYELKDLKFPSALSSDTSFSNVYTSDKLNFL